MNVVKCILVTYSHLTVYILKSSQVDTHYFELYRTMCSSEKFHLKHIFSTHTLHLIHLLSREAFKLLFSKNFLIPALLLNYEP